MMAPIYQDKNMWGADVLQKQTPQRMNRYCKKKTVLMQEIFMNKLEITRFYTEWDMYSFKKRKK